MLIIFIIINLNWDELCKGPIHYRYVFSTKGVLQNGCTINSPAHTFRGVGKGGGGGGRRSQTTRPPPFFLSGGGGHILYISYMKC